MRSPEEIQRLAQMFWPDEAFVDEATFDGYRHIIVREVHKLCQALDLEGIEDWLAVYRSAEPRCQDEPLVTQYEFGLMLTTLSIADTHAAMGSFDTMYLLFEQILDLLRAGDERRARLGLMPRGHSEIRFNIYGSLAMAKWQCHPIGRDRLMSVEEVAQSFVGVTEHVLKFLADHPGFDDGRTHESLELNGLDMAAMQFCWLYKTEPDKVTQFVDWYNDRLGLYLAAEPGYCLDHKPLSTSWYYWSFELIKLFFTGRLTKEMLDYCHAQRMAVVLNTLNKPRHIDGLIAGWEIQNRHMLAALESSNTE